MSANAQDREALARVLYEADKWNKSWDESADAMKRGYRVSADNLMAMGYRLTVPEPAPKREWPVTDMAVNAAHMSMSQSGAYITSEDYTTTEVIRASLRESARHLWRARVEGMTEGELQSVVHCIVSVGGSPDPKDVSVAYDLPAIRAALLKLGDL